MNKSDRESLQKRADAMQVDLDGMRGILAEPSGPRHTPGPLVATDAGYVASGSRRVGCAFENCWGRPVMLANATLWASSPDLYEFAVEVCERLNRASYSDDMRVTKLIDLCALSQKHDIAGIIKRQMGGGS